VRKSLRISKFYVYSVFTIISLIACIMNISMLMFSRALFLINFSITVFIEIALLLLLRHYIDYITNTAKLVRSFVSENSLEILESIPMPLLVTNLEKEILLFNDSFKENFFQGEDSFYGTVEEFLPLEINTKLLDKKEISDLEKRFLVSSKKMDEFLIFYFFDVTRYCQLKKKYEESRICVALAVFDNKEELFQSVQEKEAMELLVSVEGILSAWMSETDGILKKLSDGKYLLMFEEKYLKHFIDKKFDIINKIHEVKVDAHKFATVSFGVSRNIDNLVEAKLQAENALNMALGRGGDQVVVKSKEEYKFFGGNSPGIEKRSKVRARVVAAALLEKIKACDAVFIMGHKFSDFDSVGSSIGLYSVCARSEKKSVYFIVDRETSMAISLLKMMDKFGLSNLILSPESALSRITDKSFLIVVDTHSEKFLESYQVYHMFKHTAIIDHHRMTMDKIHDANIFFHEPFASSVCEMVTEIIGYMPHNCLRKWEAECLLSGIMLDTKNFSLKCGVRTFEAAAYLRRKGADSAEVKKIFADSMENYKIKCKIIESTYILEGCAIATYQSEAGESRSAYVQAADELLNIKDVKASFVIFKSGNGTDISARSLGEVNVQVLMESLGGGGHQTMAAVHLSNIGLKEAEEKLIDIIKVKI